MTNDPVLAGHSKLLQTGMPAERLEVCAVFPVSFPWTSILQLKLDLQEPREGTALHRSGTRIKSGSVLRGGLLIRHVMGKPQCKQCQPQTKTGMVPASWPEGGLPEYCC